MKPFFVIGSDRSGTTLLRLMLNSHPRLHVPRETEFLADLMSAVPSDRSLSPEETVAACRIILSHRRWRDLEIDDDALREAVSRLEQPRLRNVAEAVYRLTADRAGKARWGDKTPGYVLHVAGLARLFPDAQFVHLIRDARDVCVSLKNRGWRGALPSQARFWARQVGAGVSAGRPLPAHRYLEVAYEDLVLEPAATLERVCAFLDERFTQEMLTYHETAGREIAPWESELHDRVLRPPAPSDVGRWERELSKWETMVVEALAGAVMDAVGQPRRFRGASRMVTGTLAMSAAAYRGIVNTMDRLRIPTPPLTRWLGIGPRDPERRD